ncbi:MAG TPA: hypothetical protein VGM37_20900 [Armatimonadota bacterium]|jgi:hypothetical protein
MQNEKETGAKGGQTAANAGPVEEDFRDANEYAARGQSLEADHEAELLPEDAYRTMPDDGRDA